MSDVHRTAAAVWRRDMSVHDALEQNLFSTKMFPKLLSLGISLSFLDFLLLFRAQQQEQQHDVAGERNSIAGQREQEPLQPTFKGHAAFVQHMQQQRQQYHEQKLILLL
jgi:hypothetical protein